jgi:Flp pilus assembly protein TadD
MRYWKNNITLFSRILSTQGPVDFAYNNIGVALMKEGRFNEAEKYFCEAVVHWPEYPEGHFNWGNLKLMNGQVLAAAEHYQRSLTTKPDYLQAHNNLALALMQLGRLDEAEKHLQAALSLDPSSTQALTNLQELRQRQQNHLP